MLKGWLGGPGGVDGERADELLVVLSEMASNAVARDCSAAGETGERRGTAPRFLLNVRASSQPIDEVLTAVNRAAAVRIDCALGTGMLYEHLLP